MKIIALSLIMVTVLSHAASASQTPPYVQNYMPNAQKVGEATHSFLFFDLYRATLYAPNKIYNQQSPLALSLLYLKEFEGEKIADMSVKQLRHIGVDDEAQLNKWHKLMVDIFPNVRKGDKITGIKLSNGQSHFYMNGNFIGKITDPEFSQQFFAIWLSENTSAPDVRKNLLAGHKQKQAR
jgi:hypothetical protein